MRKLCFMHVDQEDARHHISMSNLNHFLNQINTLYLKNDLFMNIIILLKYIIISIY